MIALRLPNNFFTNGFNFQTKSPDVQPTMDRERNCFSRVKGEEEAADNDVTREMYIVRAFCPTEFLQNQR